MAGLWESIFLISVTMVYLSGCAPSRTWLNYGPVKADERFENSAVPKFSIILSDNKKASYETRQEQLLRSNVKSLPPMDGTSSLLTKEDNTVSYPAPFPGRTLAPVTTTVKISRTTPPSTFVKVVTQTNSTPLPVAARTPHVPTEIPKSTWLPTLERTSSTALPASRRVIPLLNNTKQVLQKPLWTIARKEMSNLWFPSKTTSQPISQEGIKTSPTTAFPVPQRTRATVKSMTKTPSSGSGKGSPASNKAGNSNSTSLIAPSSILVVPPLVTSCPPGQKTDDLGICREEFR